MTSSSLSSFSNLAVCGAEGLARELPSALYRRKREEVAARHPALAALHSELNGTFTALLRSCEMALETPGLPASASEKLGSGHGRVKKLRCQLGSGTCV